ncbi:hypothetical protein DPMN_125406 [Dreissena polymorpha]|uniref:Uncharacterized protein n=1 Tax=Dreissena polymorpha TaxID=45954 RepID=A0A9D4JX21_DREPO|nr:hypothetical protein DPMN_125406 [Dreissena polymorpha]
MLIADIPHGTNKFWDELQQLTHTLKHMSDRLGNQEPTVEPTVEPSLIREQQETLEVSVQCWHCRLIYFVLV